MSHSVWSTPDLPALLTVPTPHDPHPGRYVRHLDFNHFRTIGMRHSVEDGVTSLVTGDRIEAALKVRDLLSISIQFSHQFF
jgi:hypothetical protein